MSEYPSPTWRETRLEAEVAALRAELARLQAEAEARTRPVAVAPAPMRP